MMRLAPLSSTLPNLAAILFAIWTLLAHLAVWMGLGLDLLIGTFVVALVGIGLWIWRRRSFPWMLLSEPEDRDPDEDSIPVATPSEPAPTDARWMFRVIGAALGASTVVVAFALRQDPARLAWLGIPLLTAAFVTSYHSRGPHAPSRPLRREAILLGLGILLALLTLTAHRPDADDCLYVNLAVHALDQPGEALLREDGIYGIEGMPLALPGYRVHSWELLAAGIARLTGLPPILSLHWILPTLAAFLIPFALARALRSLLPQAWWIALAISLAYLLQDGGAHASFGNYGFVRLQQGKAVLLSLALPLVLACAMEYARRPSRTGAFRLWAVQTAAVGLSSSGLFIVPAVAWIGLLGSWQGRWDRRLLLGAACSIHPLTLSVALIPAIRASSQMLAEVVSLEDPGTEPLLILERALKMVLGQGRMRLLTLFLLLSAWAVPRDRHAARVLVLFPLCFLILTFNPWVTRFADTPLSREVWFRTFWLLPMPLLVGVGLALPAVRWPRRWWTGPLLSAVLAVWCFNSCIERSTLSSQNDTFMAWPPKVKAPPLDYEAAKWLVENTPEGARVVAPEEVAIWVPTFVKRTYPLYTRFHYQRYLEEYVDPDEVHVRRTLLGYVSRKGDHLEYSEVICYNSARFDVDGWALRDFGATTEHATSEAGVCKFSQVLSNGRYRVWTRSGSAPSQR